jgi:zinc transport system substrate-binding protein
MTTPSTRSFTLRSPMTVLAVTAALVVAACGSDSTSSDTTPDDITPEDTTVTAAIAAFYPLWEATRGVGGDLVNVTDLTPPGQGPHDLELQPAQMGAFESSDVAVFLGRGFQPQVEAAIAQAPERLLALDLLDTVELLSVDPQLDGTQGEVDGEVLEGDVDPHVWLDPSRMITMVEAITDTFAELDPDNEDQYRANAEEYLTDIRGLDGEYRTALAECRSRVIVTSHRAFGYLADTYDLRQIPIAGISPDVEPDPRTLEAIAAEAEAEGVTTIFLESIAPPDLAETVANEIGAELDLLDPIEGLTQEQLDAGETYASIMRDNLQRLVAGLDCTE